MIEFNRLNLMGVINVTPDSFSDGGKFFNTSNAVKHAKKLIDDGADILDIGGESTRPGAEVVSTEDEINRTIPVIQAIRQFSDIPISIDTSKPEVMKAAAEAGASLINDVRALQEPSALETAVDTGLPVCLMHMQGSPETMQNNPSYLDVVSEVGQFLKQRAEFAMEAGIARKNIVLDPGFGFGKTLQQNLQLLQSLPQLTQLGFPLLVGISRKSMLGLITGKSVDDRLYASISAAVIAAIKGATIIRVHDIAETRDALALVSALEDPDQF